MKIDNNTPWVISPDVRSTPTDHGFLLLDCNRDMYCDTNLLSACAWVAIKWTATGITVREIVGLLEQVVIMPRLNLEAYTCRCVAKLVRAGFVRSHLKDEPNDEGGDREKQPCKDEIPRVRTLLTN
jgi:hypothetical protein